MLAELLEVPALQRHYYSLDTTLLAERVRKEGRKKFKRTAQKALRRDSDRAIEHLMAPDAMGFIRFKDEPPILTHIVSGDEQSMIDFYARYLEFASPEIHYLLSRFTFSDVAQRIFGVGSVGTRCFVSALTGPEGKGLMLQVKEATQSVVTENSEPNITTPATMTPEMSMGERVISHQRILQSVSDPFLGYSTLDGRDFYVRQFRDAKGSFDTSDMSVGELEDYVALCGGILARAHSQSPLGHWISGYIGNSIVFDDAMTQWSLAYADQSEADYREFIAAIDRGDLPSSSLDPSSEVADAGTEPAAN